MSEFTRKQQAWFMLRELEYMPLPEIFRRSMTNWLLPQPYETYLHEKHNRPIIFIHIPKTAGTSVVALLGFKTGHVPAGRYWASDAERYQRSLKVAFVRNRWERLQSGFHYLTGMPSRNDRAKRWVQKYLSRYESFEEFILALQDKKTLRTIMMFSILRPQLCE
jgi:hypothetical protein